MKVCHVSGFDLIGQRFNGHYVAPHFHKLGHECRQLVWQKLGFDDFCDEFVEMPGRNRLATAIRGIEERLSVRSLLYPFPLALPRHQFFKTADVIHYHLIQWPEYFSILSLPVLSRLKPSIWTLHDPWSLTGHCIYPFDCERWTSGCGNCPDLTIPFAMRRDRTHFNWKVKQAAFGSSPLELIVASRYMENLVRRSPWASQTPVHVVPFGLDLNKFSPGPTATAKQLLGIPGENLVIAFRSAPGRLKGLEYIKGALAELNTQVPVTLLTFQVEKQFEEFRSKYQVIDLGWIDNEEVMVNALRAADLFLMPSVQEAFGMMAMEAMACAKPVIVFEGTSLSEVVYAPEGGIAVPMKDQNALKEAITTLIERRERREELGASARLIAEREYSIDRHVERLLGAYQQVLKRHGKRVHE